MDARTYVKQNGWKEASKVVKNCPKLGECYKPSNKSYYRMEFDCVNMDDLKTLVDAYELVQSYGGLDALELHLHSLPVNYESVKHLYEALSLVEEVGV